MVSILINDNSRGLKDKYINYLKFKKIKKSKEYKSYISKFKPNNDILGFNFAADSGGHSGALDGNIVSDKFTKTIPVFDFNINEAVIMELTGIESTLDFETYSKNDCLTIIMYINSKLSLPIEDFGIDLDSIDDTLTIAGICDRCIKVKI